MKGSIYKRGNTWTYVIDVGKDSTGKRKQKSKGGFRTKGDCQKAMDLEKYKITHDENYRGAYVSKDFVKTLGECVEEYLETRKEDWKPSTYKVRESSLKKMKHLFYLPIKEITAEHLEQLFEKNKWMKPSSKESLYLIYKIFFRYCHHNKYTTENVMSEYKKQKDKITVEDLANHNISQFFYEKSEVNYILKKLDELKKKDAKWFQECLIIKIGIYTGMRIGEILALETDDIKDNIIKVYKTLGSVDIKKNEYCITTPKTLSSIRQVNITQGLMDEIEEQKRNVYELKIRSTNWNQKHNFLFPYINEKYLISSGQPFKYQLYIRQYKMIMETIGIRFLTFHKLRHTHCSLLAHSNIPLHMIGGRLGHKDTDNITKEIYLHTTNEYGQNMADKFNEILQS